MLVRRILGDGQLMGVFKGSAIRGTFFDKYVRKIPLIAAIVSYCFLTTRGPKDALEARAPTKDISQGASNVHFSCDNSLVLS